MLFVIAEIDIIFANSDRNYMEDFPAGKASLLLIIGKFGSESLGALELSHKRCFYTFSVHKGSWECRSTLLS